MEWTKTEFGPEGTYVLIRQAGVLVLHYGPSARVCTSGSIHPDGESSSAVRSTRCSQLQARPQLSHRQRGGSFRRRCRGTVGEEVGLGTRGKAVAAAAGEEDMEDWEREMLCQ